MAKRSSVATWREIYPWINQLDGSWDDEVDAVDRETQGVLVEKLASHIVEHLEDMTLGALFPSVPRSLVLDSLEMTARPRRILRRQKYVTMEDLIGVHVYDLLDIRGVGAGAVKDFLEPLLLAGLGIGENLALSARGDEASPRDQPPSGANAAMPVPVIITVEAEPTAWDKAAEGLDLDPLIAEDLIEIARWRWLAGQQASSLLRPVEGAPESVRAARERLTSLTAAELYPGGETLGVKLTRALEKIDEREEFVLRERTFANRPLTLTMIGEYFGLSRERIRQIERSAKKICRDLMGEGNGKAMAELVRKRIIIPTPLDELLQDYPVLTEVVEQVKQPVWRILDVLDDSYEIKDGWCAAPSMKEAREATIDQLHQLANDYGVLAIDDVDLGVTGEEERPAWIREWLDYLDLTIVDDHVVLATRSVGDYAAALLSIAGEPQTVDDLYAGVGRGSRGTLTNALGVHPAISRTGRYDYALTEWGLPEYSSIRDEIAKLLNEAGGEENIYVIIDSLTERFEVSPKSVYAYAAAPPFKLRRQMVTFREVGDLPPNRDPAETAGFYRRGEQWLARETVDSEYLRGSGRVASTALATIVGITYGQQVRWRSAEGEQSFYFTGTQPTFGSIRSHLLRLGLEEGDEFFFVFGPDKTFAIEPLPPEPTDELARALRGIGADVSLTGQEAFEAFARAVECPPDRERVIEAYVRRGEMELAQLIHSDLLAE